jgi:hypothetical protein
LKTFFFLKVSKVSDVAKLTWEDIFTLYNDHFNQINKKEKENTFRQKQRRIFMVKIKTSNPNSRLRIQIFLTKSICNLKG